MLICLENWQKPDQAGNAVRLPLATAIFARTCQTHGLTELAVAHVDAMLEWCGRGLGRPVEAELHCLRGALVPDDAETCYRQALAVAQAQGARAWELRAATSLARLWQGEGKRREAE